LQSVNTRNDREIPPRETFRDEDGPQEDEDAHPTARHLHPNRWPVEAIISQLRLFRPKESNKKEIRSHSQYSASIVD
jgi:hypothetical protein